MNKKQLIVAWVMVISILLVFYKNYHAGKAYSLDVIISPIFNIYSFILWVFTILVIGGLLIYTLRDKKK